VCVNRVSGARPINTGPALDQRQEGVTLDILHKSHVLFDSPASARSRSGLDAVVSLQIPHFILFLRQQRLQVLMMRYPSFPESLVTLTIYLRDSLSRSKMIQAQGGRSRQMISRLTDGQTHTHTERDTHTYRHTDRHTDRHTLTQTDTLPPMHHSSTS